VYIITLTLTRFKEYQPNTQANL